VKKPLIPGFSDLLFPNPGYTYLINPGTPFIMQAEQNKMPMQVMLVKTLIIKMFQGIGRTIT
jgi:hypothetical protein